MKVIPNGGEALAFLSDAKHKCENLIAIFLDLELPTLGGIKILEAIRGMDRIAHLPVILMTSSNAPTDINRCRELGVSSYVNKPVTFAAFARAVANSFHVAKGTRAMVRVGSRKN